MTCKITEETPVGIIGAGPVGLASAVHLSHMGLPFKIYESKNIIAANVRDWGHVQLFSPWRYNVDLLAVKMLNRIGKMVPTNDICPTGHEFADLYLEPLAALSDISPHIQTGRRIINICRSKQFSNNTRDPEQPFLLFIQDSNGKQALEKVSAVIDCSGTWQNPQGLNGSGGLAVNEKALCDVIDYGCPDIQGKLRKKYIGNCIAVVGAGLTAATNLLALAELQETENSPAPQLYWILRRSLQQGDFGGGDKDELPERARLGGALERLYHTGRLQLVDNFITTRVERNGDQIALFGDIPNEERKIAPLDRIICATGAEPDLSMTALLHLNRDPVLLCAPALAPIIDPTLHACGSVDPHGYTQLRDKGEPGFFTAGVKSYGRASSFLMAIGYEQVRSIVAGLAGDWQGAREVQLKLPKTGVCTVNIPGCCVGKATPIKTDKSAKIDDHPAIYAMAAVEQIAHSAKSSSSCCGNSSGLPTQEQSGKCC